LAKVLAEVFALHENQITMKLTKDDVGNWDSLRQMDLVMSIEREFAITLEIPEIIQMNSIKNIISVLQKRGVNLEN